MKIVFLNSTLGIGGAERQLTVLTTGLFKRGHDVSMAVFHGGYPLERDVRDGGVPLHDLAKSGRYDLGGFLVRLAGYIRWKRPDVLYAYMMSANIFGALVKPLVRTKLVWGVQSSNLDPKDLDRAERLFYWLGGALSRFSPDLIVSNSWAGLKYAQFDGFPAHRSMVIPNGFNTEHFRPDPEARRRVREELGVAESETLVGIVGRLHPMKDHATFLKAAGLLATTRPDLRFACIGPGCTSQANDLSALANELGLGGKIVWVGPRSDMACVYNALDLLVSSSAYGEGFPNVLGEAMACGTPCVATDVGDSALVLGDVGEVSSPDDPKALHAAAARMLNRIVAGEVTPERVRGRILDHFSIDRHLDLTEIALLRLCGRVSVQDSK